MVRSHNSVASASGDRGDKGAETKDNDDHPDGDQLDSGDQAYLAIQAAQQLNEAGFPDTSIVLSSDLDELVIWQINWQPC